MSKNKYANQLFSKKNDSIVTKKSKGGIYRFTISKEILDQIQLAIIESKISFFNFMLASYCAFLCKVSNQDDFVVDSPVSIRNNEHSFNLIGWLTGALITRVKVNKTNTFRDLLLSCKNNIAEAIDHIYYQTFVSDMGLDWCKIATQINVLNDISTSEGEIVDFEYYHYDG